MGPKASETPRDLAIRAGVMETVEHVLFQVSYYSFFFFPF